MLQDHTNYPLCSSGRLLTQGALNISTKKSFTCNLLQPENAWVDSDIFTNWFHEHFVPSVTKHFKERGMPVKALLLLDNAPAHPDVSSLVSKDGNIKAKYLPANTTAIIQPIDQGVLEATKKEIQKVSSTKAPVGR